VQLRTGEVHRVLMVDEDCITKKYGPLTEEMQVYKGFLQNAAGVKGKEYQPGILTTLHKVITLIRCLVLIFLHYLFYRRQWQKVIFLECLYCLYCINIAFINSRISFLFFNPIITEKEIF